MIIYCFWRTLIQLGRKANQTKDPEDIRKFKEYEKMCLKENTVML